MTDDQRIENAIELLRPLDREGLAEVAGWIAIELGAMRTADEFRGRITNAYHRPTPVYLDMDVRGDVLPGWNE